MKSSETVVPENQTAIETSTPEVVLTEKTSSENFSLSFPRTIVDAQGLALGMLAILAFVFALQWAHKFLIPLLFSIFIAYTLNPLVVWLERIKIPRILGTSIVMITILLGTAAATNTLRTEFQSILERLPDATHKLSRALAKKQDGQPSAMQQMQAVASEIEKAASQAAGERSISKKAVVSAT